MLGAPNARAMEYDPSIDGLRGIAISLVVIMHLYPVVPRPLFVDFGWTGVDLFFVLSGYLITNSLLVRYDGWASLPSFWLQRCLRTWPAYYATLPALFFLAPSWEPWSGTKQMLSEYCLWFITHTQNLLFAFVAAEKYALGHLWSLAVEEQFYMAWPLLVFALPRKALPYTCVAFLVIAPALRASLELPYGTSSLYRFTLTHMDGMVAGALLAYMVQRSSQSRQLRLYCGLIALVAGFALVGLYYKGVAAEVPFDVHSRDMNLWGFSCLALFSTGILGWVVLRPKEDLLSRALSFEPVRRLGIYSYSIYLWHFPATILVGIITQPIGINDHVSGWDLTLWYGALVPAILLISYASFHVIERPINNFRKQLAPKKRERIIPSRLPAGIRSERAPRQA